MRRHFHTQLYIVLSVLLIIAHYSAVYPQAKLGKAATKNISKIRVQKPPVCEKWSGNIEIVIKKRESRTKVTPLGEHFSDQFYTGTHKSSSAFDYRGVFTVDDSPTAVNENGTKSIDLRGKITANALRVDEETDNWKTKTDCFPDTPAIRVAGKDISSNITERGQLSEPRANGLLVIQGSYFRISFAVPEFAGTRTDRGFNKPFGWCHPEQNPPSETNDENPVSFSKVLVAAEGSLAPTDPDHITGKAQPDAETTITWNLTRTRAECDEPLKVRDLTLAHHLFPNKTEWTEVDEKTVDGNEVRLTATVVNESKKQKSGTLVFEEKKSGVRIAEKPITLGPESETQVEAIWDTNGFAWTDDRKMGSAREIEVRVAGENETREITVVPKPVILVHGLWSNGAAWADYHNYLEEAHSFAWKAYAVGADPAHGKMNTGNHFGNNAPTNSIFQNAQELAKQIRFAQEDSNAWHVDIVAHSMGGLISRFYIHHLMKDSPDGRPLVKNLVMLGTPNQGSPWADIMFNKFKENGHHVEALRELQTSVCRTFNTQVVNRKGVKFSIVYTDKIPLTGDTRESGDGVVSVSSAIWEISDRSLSDSLEHTALTGKSDFMRFVYPRLAVGPKAK